MKKLFLIITFVCNLQTFGQEIPAIKQTAQQKNEFKISAVWRLYPIASFHFGDNAFAKAHKNGGGFGTSLALLKYGNFRAGFGYEFTSYSVSDVSKVGNFNHSNVQSFNYFISYDLELTERLTFVPNIGYGNDYVNQKTRSQHFGHYSGNHLKIGLNTDWQLGTSLAAFVGIHYINSQYDIKTNAAFEDYLQQSNQMQLTFGLKIY